MNLLALDTGGDWLSVAVQRRGVVQPWSHSGAGGAQSSGALIASIQSLMAQAQLHWTDLDAIVFGAGPGSFTGLRTACSVAQGLAFGAHVPVLPMDSLLAVAEQARAQSGVSADLDVTAMLDARMDEIYLASYQYRCGQWLTVKGCSLIRPEDWRWDGRSLVAGNAPSIYRERLLLGAAPCVAARPSACAMLRWAPQGLAAGLAVSAAQALPEYVRDKVAQTTAERKLRHVPEAP